MADLGAVSHRAAMTYRIGALLLCVTLACGDDDAGVDAGRDAGAELDAGRDAGGGPVDTGGQDAPAEQDAPSGECLRVSASELRLSEHDDVSVRYGATLTPGVEGPNPLSLLFERYDPGADVGTFPLGPEGRDGNFGDCAHCVVVVVAPDRAYFADRGTLVNRADPYERTLDSTLTDVRLVEVMVDGETRRSTPIEGGRCVELEDVTLTGTFPREGWSCDPALYDDGEACHCECGAFDPDCEDRRECPPFDPGCTPREPLPVADCGAGDVCAFDPEAESTRCIEGCDWSARTACAEGVCVYATDDGSDLCQTSAMRLDDANIEEPCTPTGLQRYCAITDGFAFGYCGPHDVCREVCDDDAACTLPGHTCRRFFGVDGLGYCGPEPGDG